MTIRCLSRLDSAPGIRRDRDKIALLVLNNEVGRGNKVASVALNSLLRLQQDLDYLIAGIPIQRYQAPDPPESELDLLKAKHRAVEPVSRDQDLAKLWQWLESEERVSARLMVGRAGTGKTRLAFEFLLQIERRLPNWQAGLLTCSALRKFDATKQPSDWKWSAPTLLVVDYAQPLAAPLGVLLRALTHRRREHGLPPLRMLLLEREPGGWFDDLLNQEDSGGPCAVRKLFDPPEPVDLTPIPAGQQRRAVLEQVLRKAAELAGRSPITLPAEDDQIFTKALTRPLRGAVEPVHGGVGRDRSRAERGPQSLETGSRPGASGKRAAADSTFCSPAGQRGARDAALSSRRLRDAGTRLHREQMPPSRRGGMRSAGV